ncbi:MetQ/NlpA family ABC transporter substrate-binding protein [Peribacillus sp. TH16]|jgi:D-methionine transport system substrate-binding protein|uniref:MetQ/NlpA family ABC transporter substrate-binding protein n=1 Tax=unclassified Peribacillus TaxID=2675266 RepID=UPI001913CC15|nr:MULTISPECIES: MetQ/NlpA family ABC transporter substrate-binding protein [unclassified Peribacillus]MBK5444559.1 MetQ/NlpA family ABC transporter substrate-binding protein [Peribacillus sp. TH24]MBK5460736.1 MetQ/NlpA family ABC transporter substrate-binding protein [Peribacillus sp. TH27]MBK5485949.1 MetQ/NlpA family ABC transporter substrate-binding protein [Peribacillus sp. TH16]
MKKILLTIMVLALAIVAAACGNEEGASGGSDDVKTVKVGVSSGDTRTWEYIVDLAKKDGLNIELVTFNDYIQPNLALSEGEIDANSFQTVAYFDEFVNDQNLKLEAIGSTVIAPMGLYSKKHKDLKDLPDGATIAVPNEATNFGRALLLLQEAGLITLKEEFNGSGSLEIIKENPKKLKIKPVAAGNTPRLLDDADASAINNNFAVEAGLTLKEALFHESKTAKPYINIIAVKKGNADRPELQKLVELYQSKEVEAFIEKTFKGNTIPAYVSVDELVNYQDAWTKPANEK